VAAANARRGPTYDDCNCHDLIGDRLVMDFDSINRNQKFSALLIEIESKFYNRTITREITICAEWAYDHF